jgi:hypothetical protein
MLVISYGGALTSGSVILWASAEGYRSTGTQPERRSAIGQAKEPFLTKTFLTKAAGVSFGEDIANELAGTVVPVTSLCQGSTETEFVEYVDMEGVRLFAGLATVRGVVAAG